MTMKCPPDRKPWRQTPEGPLPMLVPRGILPAMRERWPGLWIEAMPPGLKLLGRAIKMADLK